MKDLEEIKEKINNVNKYSVMIGRGNSFAKGLGMIDELLRDIEEYVSQVEQPALPVIPIFVADDYERLQGYGGVDFAALNYWTRNSGLQCSEESHTWLLNQDMETITHLLNGQFTVEEKNYVVKTEIGTYLILDEGNREWDYTEIPEDKEIIKYATRFNKEKADAVALLFGGTVVEVRE